VPKTIFTANEMH